MLKYFIPKLMVHSIYEIDFGELKRQGYQAVITDLDNTLVASHEPSANPKLMKWLEEVKAHNFQVVIVSNNNEVRVSKFAKPLSIPFISRALKPTLSAFRQALKRMNVSAEHTVVIGDQLLTDVLGGNRMGLYTILVTPFSLKEEGFFTKINRRIEKMAMSSMRKKGLIGNEQKRGNLDD